MQGHYNFYQNNILMGTYKNVITDSGVINTLNFLAGKNSNMVSSMVVGIGDTTPSSSDTRLVFQVDTTNIYTSIVDAVNKKIYFKGALPTIGQYEIHEVGCFSGNALAAKKTGKSALLVTFETGALWTDTVGTSVSDTVNNRVGIDSIKYTLGSSATGQGNMPITADLSVLDDSSIFSFAYYCTGLSDIKLRFRNDSSNYYESDTWSVTNGYNISTTLKSVFTQTGVPNWSTISSVEIVAIAGGSGGSISLDALRYDTTNSDGLLISRALVAPSKPKLLGVTQDIEYVFGLNI